MHVTDASVFQPRNNVVSDHHATHLKLRLVRNLSKNKNKHVSTQDASDTPLVEDPINWSLLHRNKLKRQEFADHIETILFEYTACESHRATPTQLSEAIMYAAESTITEAKSPTTNWFDASESVVCPLCDTAQRAYKCFLADGTDANKHHWHAIRRRYYRVQRQAKKQYFNQLAVQASEHAMRGGPKEAWDAVCMLEKGSTAHHRPPQDLHFHDPATGNVATTPAANLEILRAHCHKVYNHDDAPVDFSILNDIPQCATLNALGTCPSVAEIQEHITKLANNKSPGESGVPAEALKALPPDGIEYVHTLLQDYWDSHSDYEEWQTALLQVLYKKGDRKEPTNYRGIVLQDAFARLLSAIIGGCLHKLLKKCGMEEQFPYQEQTGTADAAYCLRSALQLRREHIQDTYVLFVDLIKAFDTANHDLLFEILAKYSAPPTLIDVIHQLHNNFNLKLIFDKKNKAFIDYSVGVCQGDNMAGLLFLFLMQAMDDSFQAQHSRPQPEF
jgi:hypothetical protein